MSLDPSQVDIIAIAFVVDSSLLLLSEWTRLLADYVPPLLKRLSESHLGFQFRLGFVTYATAETRPTPLLAKRFFMPLSLVSKEMRENPTKLGMGYTNSGGLQGMSALEGLVAAIELFDQLKSVSGVRAANYPAHHESQQVCHIIHFAASQPDRSEVPIWNDSPAMDSACWETLPLELKKRSINYTAILIHSLPKFVDLHRNISAGNAQVPWFPVRSPHVVLLSSFPSPKVTSKRPVDTQGVNSSDSKRVKPNQPLPQPPPAEKLSASSPPSVNTPQNTSSPMVSFQTVPNPARPPAGQTPIPESVPPETSLFSPQKPQPTQARLVEQFRVTVTEIKALEMQLKNIDAFIGDANINPGERERKKSDRVGLVMRTDFLKKNFTAIVQKASSDPALREALNRVVAGFRPGGSSVGTASIASSSSNQQLHSSPSSSSGIVLSTSESQTQPQTQSQLQPQPFAARGSLPTQQSPNFSPSVVSGGPTSTRIQPSPQLAAQMQKLMEQRGNIASVPGPVMSHHTDPGPSGGITTATLLSQRAPAAVPNEVWQGTLTWTGFDPTTQGRKEVLCQVVAGLQTGNEINSYIETWPPTLTLTPAREPAVLMPDLQNWIRKHKPVLGSFTAQARDIDPKLNESHYKSLVQLLVSKNIYAVAAWGTPSSGTHESKVLVFPVNKLSLVGAFFPISGIPELPKSGENVQASAQLLQSIPPQFLAQLRTLPPNQQESAMHHLQVQRQLSIQQQQQQRQQQLALQSQQDQIRGGPNALNYNGPLQGIFQSTNTGNAGSMGMNPGLQQSSNFHALVNMQTALGFVSPEMMENFMNRTSGGGGGSGV